MKTLLKIVLTLCVTMLINTAVQAEDYFVNKQGNDANGGRTKTQAFLTIQKGVDALKAGDTLTIGPGEYFESVARTDLGSMDTETIIRAEIPGTTLLRGDVVAPEFKKVEGYRFVYAAPVDEKPLGVLEHDTLLVVHERANVPELEFDPGFFHYDDDAKMLYISRADLSSPEGRYYTLAVTGKQGLDLTSPKRVVIDGLACTGFFPQWGICLSGAESCVVRNCVLYMNVGGVVLQRRGGGGDGATGSHNVVEDCVCYGNSFGGVVRYYAQDDIVRNCYMYKNVREGDEHFGVMHYFNMPGPLLIENVISWGHNFDFSVKPGPQHETLKNCVGLDHIRIAPESMVHCLFDGDNEYGRRGTASDDNILYRGIRDLDWDKEFADPENLDFRLQPDSRFRGAASDGSDRGPYQYEANIFYASPDGNDEADGRSSRTPWKTLDRALKGLSAGDTLYLSAGTYEGTTWENAAGAEKPIHVRGRGRALTVITGPMALTGGSGVVFERLVFTDALSLNGCSTITFNNCAFAGVPEGLPPGVNAESVKGLRVTHSDFAYAPVTLTDTSDVFLSGNLYLNRGKPAVQVDADEAILYSDYNSYEDAAPAWQLSGRPLSLDDLQKRHDDIYSLVYAPQMHEEEYAGLWSQIENAIQLVGRGPNGTTPGIYLEYQPGRESLQVRGPFLHSVSDTTANIEWWSTSSASYTLAWGETPETTKRVDYRGEGRFNTFSLTGLKPGQKYYFKIVSPGSKNQSEPLSFTTDAAPAAPKVYYVAPDGNDDNTGLSRDKAFRTVNRAASRVGPGDTIMIAKGDYNETVRIRSTGTKERPITIRSIPGEQATLRGDYLSRSFDVIMKSDYHFDGLYFRGRDFFSQGMILRDSDRVKFTRCLNVSITANNCDDLVIRNCTVQGYWSAAGLSRCRNAVIENNVFTSTILRQISADSPAVARNNIFCECIRNKGHQTLLDINLDNVKESNNCFYIRWPEDQKLVVNWMPMPVYRAQTGSDSFVANPMMEGIPGHLEGWQLASDKDFWKFFSTNPKLIVRDIGLQPEAFVEFGMGGDDWPYTRAWAEQVIEDIAAADKLTLSMKSGKESKALKAYKKLVDETPMSRRLKSDVLEKASYCAQRLKKYEQAMKLAEGIPVRPIAIRRQMEIMLARKQYQALLDNFTDENMGGKRFTSGFMYPELEDVMGDLYYYRSIAYRETGDLAAAEADLKEMIAKRRQVGYTPGDEIQNEAWVRLGHFYRDTLKDDDKALEAYLNVCNWPSRAPSDTFVPPAMAGNSPTLVAATVAACEILTRQGKSDEAERLQAYLSKAQEKTAEALGQ